MPLSSERDIEIQFDLDLSFRMKIILQELAPSLNGGCRTSSGHVPRSLLISISYWFDNDNTNILKLCQYVKIAKKVVNRFHTAIKSMFLLRKNFPIQVRSAVIKYRNSFSNTLHFLQIKLCIKNAFARFTA